MKFALDFLSAGNDQQVNTRQETEEFEQKSLESIFLSTHWNDILEKMDITKKVL